MSLRQPRVRRPDRSAGPTAVPPSRRQRLPWLLSIIAGSGLGLLAASAQAQTWTGNSALSSSWSDVFNWSGLVRPFSSPSTAITFAGNQRLNPVQDLASVFDLNALTFASGAGSFALTGHALRFAGNTSTFTQNSTTAVVLANALQISNQLTYGGNGSATWKGGLANGGVGTPVLVKNGTGQLTLGEAGSFSGRVDLNQGRLRLDNGQALKSAQVVLNSGATLDLGGLPTAQLRLLTGDGALALGGTLLTLGGSTAETDIYGGNLSATTGGLVISGGGPDAYARLSGVSSISNVSVRDGSLQFIGGSMTLNNGSEGLKVGEGDSAGASARVDLRSGALVRATGTTLQVDGGVNTQLLVTGTGSRLETGFQTLVGNHGTGTLRVDGGGVVAAGIYLAMGFDRGGNGTMEVGAAGTVSSTAGLLGVLAGATGRATVAGAGASWTTSQLGLGGFSASQRGGTGTLAVADRGVVTVSDTITFWTDTSSLTITAGQVRAGRLASDGALGSVVLAFDSSLGPALVLNAESGAASFAGVISGAGSLQKNGAYTQTLAGANTFRGSTIIDGGQLVLGHAQALQNSTVVLRADQGLSLSSLTDVSIGNLAGTGALDIGSSTLRFGSNNQTVRYSGVLQGAGGSLVKVGSGASTLAGSGSSLALLAVDKGTLALEGGSLSLVNAGASALIPVVRVSDGELQLRSGARLLANSPGASSVFVDGSAAPRLLVDGAGTRLDGGYQIIVGDSFLGSATVRNRGELAASYALAMGLYDGSRGTLRVESGGLANALAMGLGVLPGSSGEALVTGSGSLLAIADTLGMGGFIPTQNGGIGTLSVVDGASARAAETRFWTTGSRVQVDGGQLRTNRISSAGAAGHIELIADPLGDRALVIDGPDGSATFAGSIGGAGSLLKTGGGTQVLAGSNTFSGAVQVAGGTLQMDSSAAREYEVMAGASLQLGASSLGAAVVLAQPGGTVQYTRTTLAGGQLLGAGLHDISAVRRVVGTQVSNGVVLAPASGTSFVGVGNAGQITNAPGRSLSWTGGANTSGTLTVLGSTAVSGFSSGGVIDVRPSGALINRVNDLVLAGGSRTNLGKADSPGGTILLDGSTRLQLNGGLLVNNGIIAGTVQVNYGGLAKGAGQYGAVIVGDGGRFSPGNSPGTGRTGSSTWGAGGAYLLELAAASGQAGSDWDLWAIDGALDITAGNTPNSRFTIELASLDASGNAGPLAGFDAARSWQWLVVDTGAGITGFDLNRLTLDTRGFTSDTAGGHFTLQLSDGDLYLNFAPVPEPGSWALLLGGLALLGAASRGRRTAAVSTTV